MGYALKEPILFLTFLGFICMIRWLNHVSVKRTIFGWLLEGGLIVLLAFFAAGSYLDVLHTAFFTGKPFVFDQFCSSNSFNGAYKPQGALCWEVTLPKPKSNLTAPWAIAVPTMAVRGFYFIWALMVGYYLFAEFKNLWQALKSYYGLGMRPLVNKKKTG